MSSHPGDSAIESSRTDRTALVARWVGILLLLGAATLYLLTLDTGLTTGELRGGDLITHHYAQVQARPGNAPGYPIYTMLGWLWFHGVTTVQRLAGIVMPNPIPVLSAYSTLWALAALWLFYQSVRFVTSGRYRPWNTTANSHSALYGSEREGNILLAALLTAFLAVTYFFWYYATTSEQYSSAVAQTLAIFYLYLLWSEAVDGENPPRADRLLVALAFLCGLSLAHMLTVAFIVPSLVAVVLWQQPALLRRWRIVLVCLLAAALPLVAYLFVYVRGAAHPEWWGSETYAGATDWFWAFVRTSQGFQELGWGTAEGRAFFGGGFPELVWQELSIPLLVLGITGVALLRRRTALMLYGTMILYLLFCWAYRYGNWYQVVMPLYPLILLGVAAAIDRLLQWRPVAERNWLSAIPYLLLTVAILWRADASLPGANSRNRPGDTALDRPAVLLATAPEGAALFAAVDDRLGLDYLLNIWRIPKDLILVDSNNADAASRTRTLLSTWEAAPTLLAEIDEGDWRVAAESADWARVALSDGAIPVVQPLDPDAEMIYLADEIGFEILDATPAPDGGPVFDAPPAMDVRLRWPIPLGRLPLPDGVSIRPILHGELITLPDGSFSQLDPEQPLRGLLPHLSYPNPPVDLLRLPLAQPLPAGADGIRFILYSRITGEVINEVDVPIAEYLNRDP